MKKVQGNYNTTKLKQKKVYKYKNNSVGAQKAIRPQSGHSVTVGGVSSVFRCTEFTPLSQNKLPARSTQKAFPPKRNNDPRCSLKRV